MQSILSLHKPMNHLIACLAIVASGCSEDVSAPEAVLANNQRISSASAATQVDGIGYYDATDECNFAAEGAVYAVKMTGDLEGCLYVYVDEYQCSPSGTYREVGREHFVGTYHGEPGSFWTNYKFEAKYEGCAEDGSYIGAEILGRCQHPMAEGSGQGVFEGATGRLDMKDDIEEGNYPYRGHFKF